MFARAARTAGALAAAGALLAGCGEGADQGYSNAPAASPFKVAQGSVPGDPTGSSTGGNAVRVAGSGTLTAFVPRGTALRSSPGGRAVGTLPVKTTFKSPQVVTVVGQRSGWLGILTSQLPNGRVGWIRASAGRLYRTDWSIDAIVPRRQLIVRHGSRVVARTKMAVGRPGHETPAGLFAVTDKLLINRPGSPYACCVLALTGHQTKIPQGWGGGDRLAIHSTNDPSSVGQPVSLGCMRIDASVARRLVRLVPLGTQVRIVH
jgi:lipoprotein-anchoring transpeptidase ErfK/SrfK